MLIFQTDLSGNTRISHFIRKGNLTTQLFQGAGTLYEILRRGAQVSNNGPCLGYRCPPVEKSTPYTWLKYDEVIRRSEMFALGLVPAFCQPGQQTYIGIWAQNRTEWNIVEHACYAYSMLNVPIYNAFSSESVKHVLIETIFYHANEKKYCTNGKN
uniref:long-chain-fatty-acid--CoA ligase n=1 Tax=Romanomermis culicivorax TaxID=13658 RepID=A0A915KKJ1_ROMCU